MRLPYRVVGDYHVDRQEMYAQQCVQSTCTNRPKSFLQARISDYLSQVTYCGGYSGEGPPLPIPNREVKLTSADGTAPPGGRVGSCRFSESPTDESQPGFLRSGRSRHSKAAARCPISPAASQLPPGALRGEPLRHPRVASLLVESSINACYYCILPVVLLSLLYAKGDFF